MSRLRALFEEPTYAKLLHLPDYWIGNLVKDKLKPQDEALVAMYALAVDILLVLPLRRENLLELRLDTHLRRLNGRALINEIAIPAKAVKNRTGISWPIERQLAERIETYITKYRPVLAKEGNRYLFPGIGDHHRHPAEFGAELSNRVEETLGVEFNMHLVRHFSVVKYLKSHPGAYEIAAMLLGHKNPETTRRFYAGLEIDAAARHANAVLTEDRRRTKIIAIGAYHRPPSRRKLSGGRS
jgi:integrase